MQVSRQRSEKKNKTKTWLSLVEEIDCRGLGNHKNFVFFAFLLKIADINQTPEFVVSEGFFGRLCMSTGAEAA